MGFDITGKSGNYFRANVWSWRPILKLIDEVDSKYELNLNLTNWDYNNGCGLNSQEDCNKLANALEKESCLNKQYIVDSCLRVDKETGQFLKDGATGGISPYSASGEHIAEFVTFLRECGGLFQIW